MASQSLKCTTADSAHYAGNMGITGTTITMECWVNIQTALTSGQHKELLYFFRGGTSTYRGWEIGYRNNGGTMELVFQEGRLCIGNNYIFIAADLGVDVWHHVAVTDDGSTVRGYLDGVQITSGASGGNGISCGSDEFCVNDVYYEDSVTHRNAAYYRNIRVWDVCRTAAQINDNKSIHIASASNLRLSCELETDKTDSSGNGYNLSNLYGTPTFFASYPAAITHPLLHLLKAVWKLDESSGNPVDTLGVSNLTNNNTATFGAGKLANGAIMARASNQYFSCADNAALSFTKNMTIAGWMYLGASAGTNQMAIAGKYNGGVAESYLFGIRNNTGGADSGMSVYFSANGTSHTLKNVAQTWTAGVWYHFAFCYNAVAGTVECYINGASVGVMTGLPNSIHDNNSTFCLGSYSTNPDYPWDGILDNIEMWAQCLSAYEVGLSYNAGAGLVYPYAAGGLSLLNLERKPWRGVGRGIMRP